MLSLAETDFVTQQRRTVLSHVQFLDLEGKIAAAELFCQLRKLPLRPLSEGRERALPIRLDEIEAFFRQEVGNPLRPLQIRIHID